MMDFVFFLLYCLLLQVFRNPDNRGFLVRSCIFAYGVPVLIVVLNVASTVGYLDTFNAAVTCDGGIHCNCFGELLCMSIIQQVDQRQLILHQLVFLISQPI